MKAISALESAPETDVETGPAQSGLRVGHVMGGLLLVGVLGWAGLFGLIGLLI